MQPLKNFSKNSLQLGVVREQQGGSNSTVFSLSLYLHHKILSFDGCFSLDYLIQ